MLGLIKGNFNLLCRDSFVMLYESMVRSHLEYANAVWNPHKDGLIKGFSVWAEKEMLQGKTHRVETANFEIQNDQRRYD